MTLSLARNVGVRILCTLCAALSALACNPGEELAVPGGTAPVTIGELVSSTDLAGQSVYVRHAVVLAHDSYDEVNNNGTGTAYFADPGNEPGHGMQAFAPSVRIRPGDYLAAGDIVDIVGPFVQFLGPPPCSPPDVTASCFNPGRSVPQFAMGAVVQRVGFWESPTPIALTVDQLIASPQRYQGSLIELRDLEISTPYAIVVSAAGKPRLDQAQTTQMIRIGGDLYRIPGVAHGTRIRRLVGIANFFYNDFVMPRSAADVEIDPSSPVAEEGSALCSDGMDNDGDGLADCEDTNCCSQSRCQTLVLSEVMPNPTGTDSGSEWVEIYNPAAYAVALGCMSIGRGGATGWSSLTPIGGQAPAHGCLVVGAGAPHVDVMSTFSPELANGGSPGVAVGVFRGSAGTITPGSVPADALVYGDDNLSGLSTGSGVPENADVPTPPEGSSIERTNIAAHAWHVIATPTPGTCSGL